MIALCFYGEDTNVLKEDHRLALIGGDCVFAQNMHTVLGIEFV